MECRIKVAKEKLEKAQEVLQRELGNQSTRLEEKECRADYVRLSHAELSLLQQKAKAEWVKGVDTNSAYFHASLKEGQMRGRIVSICDEQGERKFEPKEIANEFVSFYEKKLLGTEAGCDLQGLTLLR